MVEVVHIPAHGNSPDDLQIIKLSTIEIDHKNAPNTYTAKIEQRLKDVPNIRDYECLFKWDSRSLVDANIKGTGIPKGWGGMYLVYKCVESVAGLPVNEHFEPVNTVRPYGDVFVFRLKEPGYVKSGMTEYGTMEKDFLQNYAHNGVARAILAALAACKPE